MSIDTTEHKFVEQRKVLRLTCYKSYKEKARIKEVCPFGQDELKETCKHCVWFKIVDESGKIKNRFNETEIKENEPIVLKIDDLKRLPLMPEDLIKDGGRQG